MSGPKRSTSFGICQRIFGFMAERSAKKSTDLGRTNSAPEICRFRPFSTDLWLKHHVSPDLRRTDSAPEIWRRMVLKAKICRFRPFSTDLGRANLAPEIC